MWRTPQGLAEHYSRQQAHPLAIASYIWPGVIALVYLFNIPPHSNAVSSITDGWFGLAWQLSLVAGCIVALAGSFMGSRFLPRSLVLEATGACIIASELSAYVIALAVRTPWWAWSYFVVLVIGYWWRCIEAMVERGRVVRLIAAVRIMSEAARG